MEQAIPPKLFPQRLRVALYGFLSALFTYNLVDVKFWSTCGPDCPKLVVQGYVELSALDVLGKSFFLAAGLALHGAYRAYRYCWGGLRLRFGSAFIWAHLPVCRFPEQAVLLQAGVLFSELHRATPQLARVGQDMPVLIEERL